jgi:hypothetical protein
MEAWPETLPQKPFNDQLARSREPNVIATEMESGPVKLRRRSTTARKYETVSFQLTKAQVEALETFFEVTLGEVGQFTSWVDTVTGDARTYRFWKGIGPAYQYLGAGYWRATMQLELMP